jgi:Bacterial PH domain/Bacterial SH3 domain
VKNFPKISRSWRAEFRLIGIYLVTLVLSIWLSRFLAWTVVVGHLFRLFDRTVFLYLPVLWLIPLNILLYALARKYDASYSFTTTDIEAKTGIMGLNLKKVRVRYEDIKSVQLTQTLEQRLLNIGDIEVSSAATSGIEIRILGIYNPAEIKRFIDNEKNMRSHTSINLKSKQEDAENITHGEKAVKRSGNPSTKRKERVKRFGCIIGFFALFIDQASAQTNSILLRDNIRSSLNKPGIFDINQKIDTALSEEEHRLEEAEQKLLSKSLAEQKEKTNTQAPSATDIVKKQQPISIKPAVKSVQEKPVAAKVKPIENTLPVKSVIVPQKTSVNSIKSSGFSSGIVSNTSSSSDDLELTRERLRGVLKKMDQLSAKLAFAETEIERLTLLSANCGNGSRVKVYNNQSLSPSLPEDSNRKSGNSERIIIAVVKSPKLNLRSGPGLNFPPLFQVKQGTSLIVESQSDNWLKVVTPTGSYAWGNMIGFEIIDENMDHSATANQSMGRSTEPLPKVPDAEDEALSLIKTWKVNTK